MHLFLLYCIRIYTQSTFTLMLLLRFYSLAQFFVFECQTQNINKRSSAGLCMDLVPGLRRSGCLHASLSCIHTTIWHFSLDQMSSFFVSEYASDAAFSSSFQNPFSTSPMTWSHCFSAHKRRSFLQSGLMPDNFAQFLLFFTMALNKRTVFFFSFF